MEGWNDLSVGYILRWFTCPQTTTHTYTLTTWWQPDKSPTNDIAVINDDSEQLNVKDFQHYLTPDSKTFETQFGFQKLFGAWEKGKIFSRISKNLGPQWKLLMRTKMQTSSLWFSTMNRPVQQGLHWYGSGRLDPRSAPTQTSVQDYSHSRAPGNCRWCHCSVGTRPHCGRPGHDTSWTCPGCSPAPRSCSEPSQSALSAGSRRLPIRTSCCSPE